MKVKGRWVSRLIKVIKYILVYYNIAMDFIIEANSTIYLKSFAKSGIFAVNRLLLKSLICNIILPTL